MDRSGKDQKREILKQERINEIIEAALSLNEENSFLDISLADIARHARFTRSNLYKYFSCREDLFLEILKRELLLWLNDLNKTFTDRFMGIKEFSHIWVDLLMRRKALVELLSLVFSYFEKKATPSVLDAWNETYVKVMGKTEEILMKNFPGAEREDMQEFFHTQLAQTVGLFPLIFLTKEQIRSKKQHNLVVNSSYYREILSHALESLLLPWV